MVHQIRLHQVSADRREYNGYFVRFREELPLVSKRSSHIEEPPKLGPDDELIEKNHFSLFVEDNGCEVLAYQVSMEGSDAAALARYLTFIGGGTHTVSLDDVLTSSALEMLKHGIVKSFEFEIAKPRSKSYAPDPNDTWTNEGIKHMANSEATRFRAKISTTSATKGLGGNIKNEIAHLLNSKQTKKLRVKLSDVDHPLDLFAERVFDKIAVLLNKGRPDSRQMFSEMGATKRACKGLLPYQAKGNEALD